MAAKRGRPCKVRPEPISVAESIEAVEPEPNEDELTTEDYNLDLYRQAYQKGGVYELYRYVAYESDNETPLLVAAESLAWAINTGRVKLDLTYQQATTLLTDAMIAGVDHGDVCEWIASRNVLTSILTSWTSSKNNGQENWIENSSVFGVR